MFFAQNMQQIPGHLTKNERPVPSDDSQTSSVLFDLSVLMSQYRKPFQFFLTSVLSWLPLLAHLPASLAFWPSLREAGHTPASGLGCAGPLRLFSRILTHILTCPGLCASLWLSLAACLGLLPHVHSLPCLVPGAIDHYRLRYWSLLTLRLLIGLSKKETLSGDWWRGPEKSGIFLAPSSQAVV